MITPIVRELGCGEQDGDRHLAAPFRLVMNGHRSGPIRLPTGSTWAAYDDPERSLSSFLAEMYVNRSNTASHIERFLKAQLQPKKPSTAMEQ